MRKNLLNCAGQRREKLNIRPARHDDAAALSEVHLDSRHEAMPWLPMLHSRPDATAYFVGHLLLHEQVFVAELNQIIVGFIALESGHVDHLYVAPSYQHRGIGHQLLDMAKTLHPDGLRLWTFQRNARARQFYEARGFLASEFTDGSRNEEREPAMLYTWSPSHLGSSPERRIRSLPYNQLSNPNQLITSQSRRKLILSGI